MYTGLKTVLSLKTQNTQTFDHSNEQVAIQQALNEYDLSLPSAIRRRSRRLHGFVECVVKSTGVRLCVGEKRVLVRQAFCATDTHDLLQQKPISCWKCDQWRLDYDYNNRRAEGELTLKELEISNFRCSFWSPWTANYLSCGWTTIGEPYFL